MNSRVTRLFKNGSNQAIRIPKEFAFDTQEVRLHREGNRLVIEPVQPRMGLAALLASWEPIEERLPEFDDQPISTKSMFD